MERRFEGRVWKFGDDVSTDEILAGRYLTITDPKELGKHAMETIDPQFFEKVRPGDIIVAGKNFGSGSSREHAPVAIKAAGISAVVAPSFARIFYRNAINVGLPVVECEGVYEAVSDGDRISIDLERGEVVAGEKVFRTNPFPPNVMRILESDGLVELVRKELGEGR